jgi:chromosome partitioning protein
VQALRDEGLPVLQPCLSASVKVRESHQLCRPLVHLDARHKLSQEYAALFLALPGEKPRRAAGRRRSPGAVTPLE